MKPLQLLLGGIPLGCKNCGVEAIVICVIGILRRLQPDAEITVSSSREVESAARLGVKTLPLFGFSPDPRLREFARQVRKFDLFLWCGANGLSDYPESALNLLFCAQKQRVPTLLWGVGMDSELNPPPGKAFRQTERMLDGINRICSWDLTAAFARCREKWLHRKIRYALEKSLLVVVRDPETAQALKRCGFSGSIVGADSSMLLTSAPNSPVQREEGIYKIGFSLSSQNPLAQPEELCGLWQRLLEDPGNRLILVPMDSEADTRLMDSLRQCLPHPERVQMTCCTDPPVVQAVAANCDVVVSSRLNLLILAANAGTPIIGIESGSKIRNWLRIFDLKPVGSVSSCDFERIEEAISGFRRDGGAAFRKKTGFVYLLMRKRLALAEAELQTVLENVRNRKNSSIN